MSLRTLAARWSGAAFVGGAVIAGVTACSNGGAAPTATPDLTKWQSQMNLVLGDPHGQGSTAGDESGSADLESVKKGTWMLEAACAGTETVRITVSAASVNLGTTDVPCGASVRFPITYRTNSPLRIQAHAPGSTAEWWVGINRPSWQQTGSFAFN